jgi:hypothetical protein
MKPIHCFAIALLAAASTPAFAAPPESGAGAAVQVAAGLYRCELKETVQVKSVSADQRSAVIHWKKKDYAMQSVPTRSGALRFEDAASGLVWIIIPAKSMLLDSQKGQRLADECRT